MPSSTPATNASVRPLWQIAVFCVLAIAGIAGLVSLGVWQVQRLAWKRDLIERIDQRIHGEPVALPEPAQWESLQPEDVEYLRVTVRGEFLHDTEVFVQAVTRLGPGFWVLTALRTAEGYDVLINRGYVTAEQRDPATRRASQIEGATEVTGLIRISEPGGGFLRDNDSGSDRWHSRDVAAIAAARGLDRVAPWFIDAEASETIAVPRGGLTVVSFRNHHLQYAITWFVLAAMLAAATVFVLRHEWRLRNR